MKVTKPEDMVIVSWTHPSGDHQKSTMYHKDDLDKALSLFEMSIKWNNIPAWVYHKGEFIEYYE